MWQKSYGYPKQSGGFFWSEVRFFFKFYNLPELSFSCQQKSNLLISTSLQCFLLALQFSFLFALLFLLFSQGLCDNPECDVITSTTGVEVNPSDFSRTYTDVYNNSEAGEIPGFARSVLDGGQAWSAKNIGDSMVIDAEEVVTLAGIITQGRFCPGPGLLEQIARSEDDCTWSAVDHECVQSTGRYAYCKPRYSGIMASVALKSNKDAV